MRISFKRYIALLWALLIITFLFVAPAAAEEYGTISISASYGNQSVSGIELKAYLCAEVQGTDFILTGGFKDYSVLSMPKSEEGWNELAVGFDGFVSANRITPDAVLSANGNGIIEFDSLEPGLYFFAGSTVKTEDRLYTSSPFFIYVSQADTKIEASLKLTSAPVSENVVRKVLKIWDDHGNTATRPESITVILYEDGSEYERVELSQANNWSYSWTLPDGHNWSVYECTPEGYISETDFEGITFTITNTPSQPAPAPILTTEVIPQTGLVWWPIMLCWVLGSVSLLLALRFRRIEKDENK